MQRARVRAVKRVLLGTAIGATLPLIGCAARPTSTTAAPAEKVSSAQVEAAADFSQEAFRIENRADRIVAVLENGATIIVQRVDSPVVAVRAYTYTGSVFEGKWLGGGLSHLLEHLVAGGTNGRRTEEQNRDLLQKIGNNSNAFTTAALTSFFVNTTPEHTAEAIDLVTGWVMTAKITPAEYAREYEVVQRELEMGKGSPDDIYYDVSLANRYRTNPTRVPVIGYQEVIRKLSRDDVYEYYKLAYVPNNMVFVVVGDVDPEAAVATLRMNLASFPAGRSFDHDIPEEPDVLEPRQATAAFPGLATARLGLAFPSIRLDDPDLYALDLLAAILGNGDSSLLTETLRDEKELISSASVSDWTPHWVKGSFAIDLELNADNIPAATAETLRVIESVKTDLIDVDRIGRMKNKLKVEVLQNQQTSEALATFLAEDFITSGDVDFTKKYAEKMQAVTPEQLRIVARKYLDPKKLLTTTLLPAKADGSAATRPAPATRPAEGAMTKSILQGGGVLLHQRVPASPLVEIQIVARGGRAVETPETAGLGTVAMTLLDAETLGETSAAAFFENLGTTVEATCDRNVWTWRTSVLKKDVTPAAEALSTLLREPKFEEDDLAPNRKWLVDQLRGRDAAWDELALNFFTRTYFGDTNPYGTAELGNEKSLNALTSDRLKKFYGDVIAKAPRVVVIAGDISADEARTIAEKYLSGGGKGSFGVPTGRSTEAKPQSAQGAAAVNVRKVEVQKTSQALAGVVVGFDAQTISGADRLGNGTDDQYAKALADTIVSGYDYPTGYLFDILRGRGLVYDVHAVDMPGLDAQHPGTFYVFAGCEPDEVNEVADVIVETMARLQSGDASAVDSAWFDRAKQMIVTSAAMNLESLSDQAKAAAEAELFSGDFTAPGKLKAGVDSVTREQLVDFARRRLSTAVMTISTPKPQLVKQLAGKRTFPRFDRIILAPKGIEHDAK